MNTSLRGSLPLALAFISSPVWADSPNNHDAVQSATWTDFLLSLLPVLLVIFLFWLVLKNYLNTYARSPLVKHTLAHYEVVQQHFQRMEAIHERIAIALEKRGDGD